MCRGDKVLQYTRGHFPNTMWCVYDVLTFFREKKWLKEHQSIAAVCMGVGLVAEKKQRDMKDNGYCGWYLIFMLHVGISGRELV